MDEYDVAVMHDYFVDRLVHAKSLGGLMRTVSAKARRGGGGIHGISQSEIKGGNAVNLAHALARLGLRTLLITHSDPGQEGLLRSTFKGLKVDLSVKPLRAGLTVAFEEGTNVMLGDAGGAGEFGPELLDAEDWGALRRSRVVCSVNWAANRSGTELLVGLRRELGEEKPIFFDPADFRDRMVPFKGLLGRMAREGLADWVSMNEQEGIAAARALGVRAEGLGGVCRALASELGVVFDLHALRTSYSSDGYDVTEVPVIGAKARRLTGAGDVWDAGAIFGRLRRMVEAERLGFANEAARLYLESPDAVPPRLVDVRRALG